MHSGLEIIAECKKVTFRAREFNIKYFKHPTSNYADLHIIPTFMECGIFPLPINSSSLPCQP